VTAGTTFYEDAADVVGALRAPDGVLVSMGNHDQWDEGSFVRALRARGAVVLRNEAVSIRRADATLAVAGLGDWYTGTDDLDATLGACRADSPIVLLSHYPRFLEQAADRGVALVLSGHTHGGQLGLPGIADRVNVATLTGQRARGLAGRGDAWLYVSAGLGTTGPPMRLGILPEIARITLRRADAGPASRAESG
jgi:predicted MPP superfamily phosphohydrolase